MCRRLSPGSAFLNRYARSTGCCASDFAVTRPKIAVLALNPHCGDGGLLGREEKEVIAPALADAAEEGFLAFGPFCG